MGLENCLIAKMFRKSKFTRVSRERLDVICIERVQMRKKNNESLK